MAFLYNIHIRLLGGEWGSYLAGIVGLLATILCITGIVLWPGWRKLATGFKIKWNTSTKRLNFDLHKVAGIIAAVFLAMAMFTGFIWNFGTWMNPVIYALTLSPQPSEEPALVSKPIKGQAPLKFTEQLLQTASAALPPGDITSISLPTTLEGVIEVTKTLPNEISVSAMLDQFSGEVIEADSLPPESLSASSESSLADKVFESFYPVHYGTFAGLASRILYVFVGLSPTILLITGFIMWWYRQPAKPKRTSSPAKLES